MNDSIIIAKSATFRDWVADTFARKLGIPVHSALLALWLFCDWVALLGIVAVTCMLYDCFSIAILATVAILSAFLFISSYLAIERVLRDTLVRHSERKLAAAVAAASDRRTD